MDILKGYTGFVLQPLPSALGVSQTEGGEATQKERDQTECAFWPHRSTLACKDTQTLFWSVLHKACYYDNGFNGSREAALQTEDPDRTGKNKQTNATRR